MIHLYDVLRMGRNVFDGPFGITVLGVSHSWAECRLVSFDDLAKVA